MILDGRLVVSERRQDLLGVVVLLVYGEGLSRGLDRLVDVSLVPEFLGLGDETLRGDDRVYGRGLLPVGCADNKEAQQPCERNGRQGG